jgi:hypothetical protein
MKRFFAVTGSVSVALALWGCPGSPLEEIEKCPVPLAPATCAPLLSFENQEQTVVATVVAGFEAFVNVLPDDERSTALTYFNDAMAIWNAAWQTFIQAVATYTDGSGGQLGDAIQGLVSAIVNVICVIETVQGAQGCTAKTPVAPLAIVGADAGPHAHAHAQLAEAREQLDRLRIEAELLHRR